MYSFAKRRKAGLAGSYRYGMLAYAAQSLVQFVGLLTRMFSVTAARPSRLLRISPNDLLSQKGGQLHAYSTSDQIRRIPDSHRVPLFSKQECVSIDLSLGRAFATK